MNRTISYFHATLTTAIIFMFWSAPALFALIQTIEGPLAHPWIRTFGPWMGWLMIGVFWTAYLLGSYRHKSRHIAAQYRKEFAAALLMSGVGILGTVMFLTEALAVSNDWIPHLILALFVINYSLMTILGHRIYHVRLFDVR